jgi:hypothetical protein
VVVCCLTASFGASQPITGHTQASTTNQGYQITFTVTFSPNDLTFETQTGYDVVQLNDGDYTADVGKPMIPVKTIRVALPENMQAAHVTIQEVHQQPLEGTYLMYPAQPAQPSDITPQDIQFVQPDMHTYQSSQLYPTPYLELIGQNDLAGQSIVDLMVYPLHYQPAAHQLSLVTSLTFTIDGTAGYVCRDYLPASLSPTNHQLYQQMVQDMVINPQDVVLHSSPTSPQPLGVDPGDYDYVIITQTSWVSAFQPLQEWKTKKGVPTNIVTTDWIYNSGGYSGTNVEKIRAFVQDAYTNWGTVYFLLGGDTNVIPCNYKTFSSVDPDSVPNDAYYADFDADYVCEVNVGRASVTGTGNGTGSIGNFINKVLTYETDPPLTDYIQKAGFFGFDLDGSTHAEQCKINIDNLYIPASWTTTTVYDSQGGNHKTNVINTINAGQNLLNHADHSSSDYMGTGYINHNWGLENADMDALSNGNKQGILYSMGCDPAAFDVSNCIGEHFVRNSNGGGIAFIGNARYGWYNPGNTNSLSMRYDVYFFRSLFQQGFYNLGVCFSDHKNDALQNNDYSKYCFTELTLLGEPELPIWTETPGNLTVSFPNQIPTGATDFTVSVTSSGSPVDQATVCLWKGDDVYVTGYTTSAGSITFTISPSTQGSMYVTVTKHNYLPFEGSALILSGENNPPEIPSKPTGPTIGLITTDYSYTTSTTDPENDQVYYKWSWGTEESDWTGPYTSGAATTASYAWAAPGTYSVKVKAKDIFGFESSWSPSLLVTISEPKPNITIGTFTGGLFDVTNDIKNIGDAAATNVQWNITITGGILISGQTQTGNITTLGINSMEPVSDSPIIGFGRVTVTITVSADGVPEMTKTTTGFVLLIYVIV